MRRLFFSLISIFLCLNAYAQKNVTTFMGIPIDGTPTEMIHNLKKKGFKLQHDSDFLEGKFNGCDALITIHENGDKVWRLAVLLDVGTSETNAKSNFNRLCRQFSNNPNYSGDEDQFISENEDISYEITVHDKQYAAEFFQISGIEDNITTYLEEAKSLLSKRYTREELDSPTDDVKDEIVSAAFLQMAMDRLNHRVWMTISKIYNTYYIIIYYENGYNEANGEDL